MPSGACLGGLRDHVREALRGRVPHGSYRHHVRLSGTGQRAVRDEPSPIPKFDTPKMHRMPAVQLFGAGREKRIYAIPPYTDVKPLDFEDVPFEIEKWSQCCALCGATDHYLDEIVTDDGGGRLFVCSDTDACARRRAEAARGSSGNR